MFIYLPVFNTFKNTNLQKVFLVFHSTIQHKTIFTHLELALDVLKFYGKLSCLKENFIGLTLKYIKNTYRKNIWIN